MTPPQLTRARQSLGLTLEQFARMLGYDGVQSRSQVHNLETGRRTIRPAQRRLIDAYLSGYRPEDWPSRPTSSSSVVGELPKWEDPADS